MSNANSEEQRKDIMTVAACVGLGLIGSSWAVAFARHADTVRVYDPLPEGRDSGLAYIDRAMTDLGKLGIVADPVAARMRIRLATSLEDAVADADFVQESATENRALKRALMAELDAAAPAGAVIASSTSEIPPSEFMTGHRGASRMLVAHPLNPPHLVPAVELCPSPETRPETVARAKAFMAACGQAPLVMTAERKGFVMNRLQIALVREAWHLVAQGVCTPQDVDIAVRDGLAHRWSVIGPFETFQLTTRKGYAQMLKTYAETLANIAEARPTTRPLPAAMWGSCNVSRSGHRRRRVEPLPVRARLCSRLTPRTSRSPAPGSAGRPASAGRRSPSRSAWRLGRRDW
jgi:3-hydroxyacyl-CoA dehydrogenase